jgi:hypothetical protein
MQSYEETISEYDAFYKKHDKYIEKVARSIAQQLQQQEEGLNKHP